MTRSLPPERYYEMLRYFMKEEEEEETAFRGLAERVENPRIRALLLDIASDANTHKQMLDSIYHEEYAGRSSTLLPVEPEVLALFKAHIRREGEAMAFYEKMASHPAISSVQRLMFAELAAAERRHHAVMEIAISVAEERRGFIRRLRSLIGSEQPVRIGEEALLTPT